MLIGIHIQNFGVLHDTTLGLLLPDLRAGHLPEKNSGPYPGIISIRPLSALIGRNSTGKSSLLNALAFLADSLLHGVKYAATMNGRQGFAKLLTVDHCREIVYDLLLFIEKENCYLNYNLAIACDGHGRPHIAAEKVIWAQTGVNGLEEKSLLELTEGKGQIFENGALKPTGVSDKNFPALAAFGSLLAYPELMELSGQISRWYFCNFSKQAQKQPRQRAIGGQKHLNASCDNVADVMANYRDEHPDEYKRIIGRINDLIPDDKAADEAFFKGGITSGSLKLFTFMLLLEDPHPRPLICLEEPDAGLYHDMVDTLALEMREYTIQNPGCQILFTTHNPYILESLRPDEIWVFERREAIADKFSSQITHFTKARCVGADPVVQAMYEEGVGMGSLWYSGHFDQQQEE